MGLWPLLQLLLALATLFFPVSESWLRPPVDGDQSLVERGPGLQHDSGELERTLFCPIGVVSTSRLPKQTVEYLKKYNCISASPMDARPRTLEVGQQGGLRSNLASRKDLRTRFRVQSLGKRLARNEESCEEKKMKCLEDDGSIVTPFTEEQPLGSPFCAEGTGLNPDEVERVGGEGQEEEPSAPCVPLRGTSGCAATLECAQRCAPADKPCRSLCEKCEPIPGGGGGLCQPYSKKLYENFTACAEPDHVAKHNRTCTSPKWPDVLKYQIPSPEDGVLESSGGERDIYLPLSFQASERDHCDDLTEASSKCCSPAPGIVSQDLINELNEITCPCVRCVRFNIVYSMEKAEMIAIIRATDKVLAVCRNARICVSGLKNVDRYTFFDTRPGFGPCMRWAGGDRSSCALQVLTKISRISWGWRIVVRTTFGEEQWAFPVNGLQHINRDFTMAMSGEPGAPPLANIDLRASTAAGLAKQAYEAPQKVLVVARDHDQELIYDIKCSEVAEGYPLNFKTPALPPYVTRKIQGAGPVVDSAIDPPDLRITGSPNTPFAPLDAWPKPRQVLEEALKSLDEESYGAVGAARAKTGNRSQDLTEISAATGGAASPAVQPSDMVASQQLVAQSVQALSASMDSVIDRLGTLVL